MEASGQWKQQGARSKRASWSTPQDLYADKIAELAGDKFFTIHPRKGETIIFDKSYRPVQTVLATFSMVGEKSAYSKGGGLIPTVDAIFSLGRQRGGMRQGDVSTTAVAPRDAVQSVRAGAGAGQASLRKARTGALSSPISPDAGSHIQGGLHYRASKKVRGWCTLPAYSLRDLQRRQQLPRGRRKS